MLKVMTIIGTRPELIKMSRVISEFDEYTIIFWFIQGKILIMN